MSISLRVIDCTTGQGASGLTVHVQRRVDGDWAEQSSHRTDDTGTLNTDPSAPTAPGIYRLVLDTDAYCIALGFSPLYPSITLELRKFSTERSLHVLVVMSMCAYFVCQMT
jgi:5-hydroxyisourate hydrolase